MTTIRFVHTDFLRLGTPLVGIASPPTWLLELATASVRHAVRNVIETTMTQRADFLLIAGSICDSAEDLESATRWLHEQFAPLRREGIQVVAVVDDHQTSQTLGQICDVVMSRTDSLYATTDAAGSLNLSTAQHHNRHSDELVITTGSMPTSNHPETGRLHYHAVPAIQHTEQGERRSIEGTLSLSAGAVQSTSRSETGNYGCIVVDADLQSRELSSEFTVSNPVRFVSETLHLTELTTVDQLVNEIAQASKSLHRTTGQTVIVDWTINAQMHSDWNELSNLDHQHLLRRLRNHLESGHLGVWPRAIGFGETADLQFVSDGGAAVEEHVDVATGSVTTQDNGGYQGVARVIRGGRGVADELIAGLRLLADAA